MPASVHPTALVDPSAELAEEVEVGPYCIVGAGVQIGRGTRLQHHVTILGPTRVGEDNVFFAYCSIGQQTQDLKYQGEPTYLEIGDRNSFREFCTVNRATMPGDKTVVGSDNHFLSYSHIGHDCVVGNHVIFSNNGTLGGHVEMGDHAIISGLSAVHQFCRIGERSMIGGCSKVVQDVPPFCIVDGNPAVTRGLNLVGLQRAGFSEDAIRALRRAFRLLFRQGLNAAQALAEIRKGLLTPEVERLVEFAETTQRGLTPGRRATDGED
ncbi:MAG: acyl-ACP--UDP-N-acetylglucosamine O-acyltransferase [Verrucomicrobiales bacterium]|nr:acyl-ACP--UDP-N-acetylglucosamine O-acyltransferase [Verrucomicrobiales bacterium]